MGSHLSVEQLAESLEEARGARLVLALDRDATGRSLELTSRYGFLSKGTLTPLLLSKDLKYHTTEEIQEMVNGIVNPTLY
jgi:hypothetical protein